MLNASALRHYHGLRTSTTYVNAMRLARKRCLQPEHRAASIHLDLSVVHSRAMSARDIFVFEAGQGNVHISVLLLHLPSRTEMTWK